MGLPADALEQPLWEDWTLRRLLPHIARWEALEAERLQRVLEGRISDPALTEMIDTDAQNAVWHTQFAETPLAVGVAMLLKERNGLLNILGQMPDDLLQATVKLAPDLEIPVLMAVNNCIEHDEEHAADIWRWREAHGHVADDNGPADLLVAALRAERKALLAALALSGGPPPNELLAHLLEIRAVDVDNVDNALADLTALQQAALNQAGAADAYLALVGALRARLPLLEAHYGNWLVARRTRR